MKSFAKRDLPFLLFLALAVALLMMSSANVTRAAQRYESNLYKTEVKASNIGVTLCENGVHVSSRDNVLVGTESSANDIKTVGDENDWVRTYSPLLTGMTDTSGNGLTGVYPGVKIPERLAVYNSGEIDTYVRLIIRRYWAKDPGLYGGARYNADGSLIIPDAGKIEKLRELDPAMIEIGLANTGVWEKDTSWYGNMEPESHETIILYYKDVLAPNEQTPDATEYVMIDGKLAYLTKVETVGNKIITTYDYNGATFVIEAEADAIQTHNAKTAMRSAWGYDPSFVTE